MFQKIKCTAMTVAGIRCDKWAVQGATVCATHGGAAPQVGYNTDPETGKKLTSYQKWRRNQEVMKERLAELGDQAVATVQQVLEHGDRSQDRLRAAEMVLDRFVPKKSEVEVSQHEERDLDLEIEQAIAEDTNAPLPPTGTDSDDPEA